MTEYFKNDGCLTDGAFRALISGEELPEITRLEISEHLSYCDSCVFMYAEFLEEASLIEPPEAVAPGVMERIKRRAQLIFFNRYVAAGLAACFALTLWGSGFFDNLAKRVESGMNSFSEANQKFSAYSSEKLTAISDKLSDMTVKLSDSLDNNDKGRIDDEKE